MSRYDVVVVGGRVAGASTALLLARAGARVAVVERGDLTRDTVSTHALMRAGVLQLSRWGVLDRIVAAGTPAVRHTTFGYADGERVRVSIRDTHGVEALYAPRRTLLDRVLIDEAEAEGAAVHRRTDVVGLTRAVDGRVTGVATRGPSGEGVLTADLVVGADGIRSTVAREVGATTLRQGRTRSAVLYRYVRGLDVTGYEWFYGDRAAAGLIPTDDEAVCVFVSTTPGRMRGHRRAGREQAFTSLLEAAGPGLGDVVRAALRTGAGCGDGEARPATYGGPRDRAGPSSATPATTRTRSVRTGSPTPSATRTCSPTRSCGGGRRSGGAARHGGVPGDARPALAGPVVGDRGSGRLRLGRGPGTHSDAGRERLHE